MSYTPTVPGPYQTTCQYSGDVNYLSATSYPTAFTVIGPDFSLLLAGATTQTVTAGQTATFANAISVTALDGFAAQVNFSCSTNAPGGTCSVNPPSLSPGAGSATISVVTSAIGNGPPAGFSDRGSYRLLLLTLLLFLNALVLLLFSRLTRAGRLISASLLSVFLAIFLLTLGSATGCGGGSSAAPPTPPPPSVYTVTVTGTSGPLAHAITLTLLVQSGTANSN